MSSQARIAKQSKAKQSKPLVPASPASPALAALAASAEPAWAGSELLREHVEAMSSMFKKDLYDYTVRDIEGEVCPTTG